MFELESRAQDTFSVSNSIEDEAITEIRSVDLRLWKLLSAVSSHLTWDFPVLHPSRSNVTMILSIPSFMTMSDLKLFIHAMSPFPNKITVVYHNVRSVIIEFKEQTGADTFYINSLGKQFSIDHPYLKCITLFLTSISPPIKILSISTLECEYTREFQLPICPICFQIFDPLISTYFSPATTEEVSRSAYDEWGKPKCPICIAIRTTKSCFACSEKQRLWVCMECGHIGCGRDQNQHAVLHFESTGHRFALRFDDCWLWDYIADRSVDRSFHDQLSEASEDVVTNYRKLLLEGIMTIRQAEEEKREKMHQGYNKELTEIHDQLLALEEEENALDDEYNEVLLIDKEIEEIQAQIKTIRECDLMIQSDELRKQNSNLERRLVQLNERIQELYRILEERSDVTGQVVLENL